ncbi:class I SAM-dependent DNA methyltransferase [Alcaligenes aquatilis]|uniref:site-specific DNA-methyltransferase (adenine-specific) n=1 Tax=Alcaligenes aquatilis TaxID=323284 RepID=A0A3G2HU49_9BURK|nr:DNA methyltransferase [Alcaligenes aquatilis]AYN20670.1 class I SAM-dependent DNA methyltransferase [Alcaligenes aquatilis]
MNAVEIEQAISELALQPFDPAEFAYAFLEAFGNKATTLKKLRSGASNKSDLGGVLQTKNIHIAVAEAGAVTQMLTALKASPATSRAKARFILATDGESFEAEDLDTCETVACSYQAFPDHFGFFLPLAGITTVKQLRDSSFDIRATSRLNRLYVELLKDNPGWGTEEQRHEMNHFMSRLIFCFFAEDTDIFSGSSLFTDTVAQMSARDSANTHEVISEIFRAMNTKQAERAAAGIPRWADAFPYVNGGLFSGSAAVPEFSKIARSYLLHIGGLDWTQINPDIFGSMIQAVADDEERGALGMHYTSVPNILKVLNPLFLDDLREKLAEAGDNSRKLLNLRNRMARIRVFDPACGSGNFLVIAYKQMREIEAEINQRRGERDRLTDIPLTNFRGIELRNFSAEIARLALIIAEYQCNVQYRGKQLALNEFLPLSADNWITCGNALRLDWLAICPPIGTGVKVVADDLFEAPLDQVQIDFENEGGETYICGNPPYKGSQDQTPSQKADLAAAFAGRIKSTKSADYVSGWFILARDYMIRSEAVSAFVTTNSLNQGRQVSLLWPAILSSDLEIRFARPSFLWSNLASKKAAVTVSIVGLGKRSARPKLVFTENAVKQAAYIGPYLVPDHTTVVSPSRSLLSSLSPMTNGSMPNDGGGLLLDADEYRELIRSRPAAAAFCRKFLGSHDSIQGDTRYCLWIADADVSAACAYEELAERVQRVRVHRENSGRPETNALASIPHSFGERRHQEGRALLIPRHSSESRPYLPSVSVTDDTVIGDSAIAMYDFTLPDVSIYSSRLHLVWIATVCGKIKEDYRYSNSLGWNTFPVPFLTEKNKADLTRCAEDILLAREAHFPATIADLYNPDNMPDNLRAAHERNDEVLERIYIGRRFKNDTERLEKLFELYTKMTEKTAKGKKA